MQTTKVSTVSYSSQNNCSRTEQSLHLRGPPTAISDGSFVVKPVLQSNDSSFGAEIGGVDWTNPIPAKVVRQLVDLQDKYAVLIFRGTGLDNDRHIAFSQQLGEKLEVNPFFHGIEKDRLQEPFLWDVSNIELDGSLVEKDSRRWHHSLGNALWHTVRVLNHLWHSRRLASPVIYGQPTAEELSLKPPAFHKLVQTAPDGRKTLYLAAHAKKIAGRSFEDSQKLIWELIEHCTQPEYVFSMEWLAGGDMVWWDNRQCMHRANAYTENMTARDVRRATVIDDGPLAFGVNAEELVPGKERKETAA
ncbi:hypothetical protein M409DRAFT_55238 [Zasmidium cellare ATCC 36951]|uniref:TauD/TfdA-like domain-containing protein n=1 Tax=Zasmidium cellare ATCC 36951 TaxID=1080233 RepID=A0A6A6CI43_ZASCE|nr:uncharacterized protein M409DRAFT_55238 [Zasmidium cellare ATCC 36951]KAF2165858.1 hypothetical protein M409DRAFT_55238 [Zasmidium cellare ATCC 36951]